MKRLFVDIFQNIAAEFAEIFEVLKGGMNFNRVNFGVLVRQKISQASHRHDLLGEVVRNDIMTSQDKYCIFIILGSVPAALSNQMMGYVKEGLYAYL